ncbi:hypothetical protein M407DRAFT_168580 [Tulasnella calospora MUT 4182]|uniref:Alpha-ketoglutarate-dependent dioxygenase AlkB-like domain-containing protein n=1 Tax=Tulasnella calospora MUT 4182 TaxID=1051891 RepID=A0A0C3QEC8_9AGAM|nr:hypothetical protein M407DRAFT_168580 [Tulasnella calospora MUT 4182]
MLRSLIRSVPARSLQARREISTTSYTLTERQPSNSLIWIRAQPGSSLLKGISPLDFQLYTNVLAIEEQNELLKCALKRLDEIRGVSRTIKKRRKDVLGGATATGEPPNDAQNQFLPDNCYEFDEGHYDGVIHKYRESHVSAWPESARTLLVKAGAFMPGSPSLSSVQTHALHLASDGEILSHVDNVEASGKTIIGISLGAARVLRLQPKESERPDECVDILLESGSVYVQTDSVRYNFVHSVPLEWQFRDSSLKPGQRMSIMIRDLYTGSRS